MQTRTWGATGVRVPVIGQGTWRMEGDDRRNCIAAIRAAIDAGATHIDTAELYGRGRVEEMTGEALAGRRDEVFLVSKVLPTNATRAGAVAACERSLKRLRTDRLDGYLLHWPGDYPLEGTIAAFEELQAAGKIRSYGVSNFDAHEIEAAVRIAGPGRIACNQVLYHLGERAIEHAVIPTCERHGITPVAYSPFGAGHFVGDRGIGARVLAEIAAVHAAGARPATPRQVAFAFLVRRPSLLAIPKSATAARVVENSAAGDITLTPAEIARIDAAFPLGAAPRELPTI